MRPELFQTLFCSKTLKIERITSHGHATPTNQWLRGRRNEWVTLLSGKASLRFQNGRMIAMKAGSSVFIRAGRPHRVEWTRPGVKTVWLAVHFDLPDAVRPKRTAESNNASVKRWRRVVKKQVSLMIVIAPLFFSIFAAAAEESWDALNSQVIQMYQKQYYTKAIPVAQKALDVAESTYGSDSSQTVLALNNLAMLYKKTNKHSAAERLYLRELTLSEKLVGLDHPDLCVPLNNLAMLYDAQKHYKKADEYSTRAINILETAYGSTHAQVQEARWKYSQMKLQR